MNIQITGASGSGKTFLGKELSKVLKCNFIDTDDILWLWDENIPPYTVAVSDEESCEKLRQVLLNDSTTVASGMFYPWSESLIPMFDLLIVIDANKEIRKKRIIDREYEMYGDRFKKGGDMYEQFNEFLDWSMSYDISDDKLGSKKATYEWTKRFDCEILYIDGSKPIKEKINIVLTKILEIKENKE